MTLHIIGIYLNKSTTYVNTMKHVGIGDYDRPIDVKMFHFEKSDFMINMNCVRFEQIVIDQYNINYYNSDFCDDMQIVDRHLQSAKCHCLCGQAGFDILEIIVHKFSTHIEFIENNKAKPKQELMDAHKGPQTVLELGPGPIIEEIVDEL